jgi:hypothetical protein
MNPDDIEKAIHDGIAKALEAQLPIAVQTAVDASVNGKIKALDAKMTPIVNAWGKWTGAKRQALTIIGIIIGIGSLMTTAETLWSFVTGHIMLR